MELKKLEEDKNKLVIQISGEDATFCNALKAELLNDENVKIASFTIEHPLTGIPKLMVITDGKKTPKQALEDAAKRLKKKTEKFEKEFANAK